MSERIQRFIVYGFLTPLLWINSYYFIINIKKSSVWISLIGIACWVFLLYMFLTGKADKKELSKSREVNDTN